MSVVLRLWVKFEFAPQYLAEVLQPVHEEVLAHDHGLFTIFIVLAIWAAMRAVEAINRAFYGIYGECDGSVWIRRKSKALITVFVSAISAAILDLCIFSPSIDQNHRRFHELGHPEKYHNHALYCWCCCILYLDVDPALVFTERSRTRISALARCVIFHNHMVDHGNRFVVLSRLFWNLFCHLRRIGGDRYHNVVPLLFWRYHTIWCRTKRGNCAI